MRTCTRCKVDKNEAEFYSWIDKHTDEKRFQSWCKSCMKTYSKDKSHGNVVKVETGPVYDKDTPWELKKPSNNDKPWPTGYKCGFCCTHHHYKCAGSPCTCTHDTLIASSLETPSKTS